MTPTLFGRWQTRIFLLATVGIVVSLPFALGLLDGKNDLVYFWVLLYVGLFGLAWDVLYDFLQKYMWDHDWPGVFQLFSAIIEGLVLGLVIKFVGLPNIPGAAFNISYFVLHYSVVWAAIYVSSWMVMRLLFPRARFRGGEWIGKWPKA